MAKQAINDDALEQVVGGLMRFNYRQMIMTYTHEDGSETTHHINDFDGAWELSNKLHGKNWREDDILRELYNKGYIR